MDEAAASVVQWDAIALRALLLDLMEGAGLFELRTEALAHPGLEELGSRVRQAARQVILNDGKSAESILWTDPAALWYGSMAKTLDEEKAAGAGDGTALLLAFASDAGPHGLLWRNARSLRALHGFHGDFTAGGPYLVLMKCSLQWPSDVIVETGFVLPILDSRYGLPVRSHLERDVCRILIKVQELVDSEGGEATIRRKRVLNGLDGRIVITVANPRGVCSEKQIICEQHDSGLAAPGPIPDGFVVTPSSIRDPAFAKWLVEVTGR